MTPMRKEDMIRLLVHSFPGDFFLLFLKLSYLFLFFIFGDRFFMAFKAGRKVRHSRKGLGFKKAVASVTLQTLFQMFFVIERDRLIGFKTKSEVNEEE